MMGEELVSNGKWIYICVGNQEVMFPGGAWSMEEIREELARGGKDHELLFACCACLQQVYVAPRWCCSAEVPEFLPVKHFCLMSSLNLSTCTTENLSLLRKVPSHPPSRISAVLLCST